MTRYHKTATKLYVLNLAVLATHEIDSAFWHEWKLFQLPGGIDLFLILNLLLLLLFMHGLGRVVKWEKGARIFSLLLALSGLFAFFIHSYFILAGHPEFTTAISITILILALVLSIYQIVILIIINHTRTA